MTQPLAAGVTSGSNIWRSWSRFWFEPADPTLLGFIRICCGLVVLYVHLVYTPDLQQFFGQYAWIDKQAIDEFRHERPWPLDPPDWEPRDVRTQGKTPEERQFMLRWYGPNPNKVYAKGYEAFSIWYHVTDPTSMMVIHCVILTMMFLFTIGFCTRVTSVLSWLGALSYIQRAPTSLFGMDTMMNLLLFYLMIGPSGAALSVDRLIARHWVTWQALRRHQAAPMNLQPAPRVSAKLALRLIQVNFCIIYLASGLYKLQGAMWLSGTAVWGTMAVYEYSPMAMASYESFLVYLSQHRWLWELVMTSGVAFTLATEIGVPFLIWNRKLRWVMITMAVMLHTGIAVVMGLRTFSLFMVIMLMAFVPEETVHALVRRLGRGVSRFRLGINDQVRGQVRAASVIRAFDAWDQVEVLDHASARRLWERRPAGLERQNQPVAPVTGVTAVPPGRASSPTQLRLDSAAAEGERLELVTAEGEILTGYQLFERLTRSVRPLWPVALVTWIPGLPSLARRRFPGGNPPSAVSPKPALKERETAVTR